MKERYEAAKMDVVLFEVEDVITTSGEPSAPSCPTELPELPQF